MNTTLERLSAALTNRYRVDRELGAGGMATVYLAPAARAMSVRLPPADQTH